MDNTDRSATSILAGSKPTITDFEDKDITKDGLALEELKKLGYMTPPFS